MDALSRKALAILVVAGTAFASADASERLMRGPRTPIEQPGEHAVFRDSDPVARARQTLNPQDPATLSRAEYAAVVKNSHDPRAWAQLAYLKAQRGEHAEAWAACDRATSEAAFDAEQARYVDWSCGWAWFALDEPERALAHWHRAVERHGGLPFWAPYTYATGLMAAGRSDEAVAWYAVAARSFPERYATRDGLTRVTRAWKPKETAAIDATFVAWQASTTRPP